MKISELNQKSFLGGAGAAQNSYVLINYEDNSTTEPVTYRASIDELGKAIANNLHLYKETQAGVVTTGVSQGAYVDGTAKQLVTTSEKSKIDNAASTGYVTSATNGLASTGYVTTAISNAVPEFPEYMYFLVNGSDRGVVIQDAYEEDEGESLVNVLTAEGYGFTDPKDDKNYTANFVVNYGDNLYYISTSDGSLEPISVGGGNGFDVTDGFSVTVQGSTNSGQFLVYNSTDNGFYYITQDGAMSSVAVATSSYVTSAIANKASTGAVTAAVTSAIANTDLREYEVGDSYTLIFKNPQNELKTAGGSTVTAAMISGAASTGYVTANAGPSFGAINASLQDSATNIFGYVAAIAQNEIENTFGLAYIDTSDNKPCIRNAVGTFQGFLSAT